MAGKASPAWIAAFQTLRREMEEEILRDTRDRRDVEQALMIVRESEVAPNDSPDAVPAVVCEEDEKGEPERFPFRADLMLGLQEAPDGPYWADLRYKTAANLWYDMPLAPRYVERGIFTSWDERHRGITYGPDADRERDRSKQLDDLLRRGAVCLHAMPDPMKQRFSVHVLENYWLQCLFEVACQGVGAPLITAVKQIWCRESAGKFAEYCREHECLFPVDWESRQRKFRTIRRDLRDRGAEIPPSLLVREPTTYCVWLDDVLRQSIYMIDWLCNSSDASHALRKATGQVANPSADEIAEAHKACRAKPTITRGALMRQMKIGSNKASCLIDMMRKEGIHKTRKRMPRSTSG